MIANLIAGMTTPRSMGATIVLIPEVIGCSDSSWRPVTSVTMAFSSPRIRRILAAEPSPSAANNTR